jgi:hypothetical protein
MTNEQLFIRACEDAATICGEFCTNFKEDSVQYLGLTVFKSDVEYLETLRVALGL